MKDRPQGDSRISAIDMRLWSLVQHVLHTWNTLVIFNLMGCIVPESMGGPVRGLINFMVPVDSEHKDRIVAFLKEQLADLQTKDWTHEGTVYPGRDIGVDTMCFSGLQPFVTVEHSKEIETTFVRDLLSRFRREGKTTDA